MTRPDFRDGRILRTADFVDEQAYHLENHRRHQRTEHVWGVASGLGIAADGGDVVVEPGTAVDGYGRDVVLACVWPVDLRGYRLRGIDTVDVQVVYARTRVPATGDGVDVLVDAATVETAPATDTDPRRPPEPTDTAETPDDPTLRWPVPLGRVTLDLAHPDAPPTVDIDRRPFIGLIGSTVERPGGGGAWLELSDEVDDDGNPDPTVSVTLPGTRGPVTPLTVSASDGVTLNARLSVEGDLVLHGGSVSVLPPATPADPAVAATEWSVSHAEDDGAHELRVAMPPVGSGAVPNRLVVGAMKDGQFSRSLVVDESGTVMVAGNLVVEGTLQAASVQEAELSEQARLYLAGFAAAGLLTLFQTVPVVT